MTGRQHPLLMALPEAARYLGRSAWWVRDRARAGDLPTRRVGARLYVSRPDLDRWLSGEAAAPTAGTPALGVPSPTRRGRRVG